MILLSHQGLSAAQILRQAAEADQAEDRQQGAAAGDELPAELANPTGRLDRLRKAKGSPLGYLAVCGASAAFG
jgi:hypothetical protein